MRGVSQLLGLGAHAAAVSAATRLRFKGGAMGQVFALAQAETSPHETGPLLVFSLIFRSATFALGQIMSMSQWHRQAESRLGDLHAAK